MYTDDVPNNVASVTMKPTVQHSGASVTVNGYAVVSGQASPQIELNQGEVTTKSVVVTPQCGSPSKTYVFKVYRAKNTNAKLKALQVNTAYAPLHPIFSPTRFAYYTSVPYDAATTTVTWEVEEKYSNVRVNGKDVDSETSGEIALKEATNNTITVEVTAQDTNFKIVYNVSVFRHKAPPILYQLVRGALRNAECLLPNPHVCHLEKYYMKGVAVNMTNPHDGTVSNNSFSDHMGFFEVSVAFSHSSKGKMANLNVNWKQPTSEEANLPNGGIAIHAALGHHDIAGQGYASDLQHDAGFLYWYPAKMGSSSITGRVLNALTNDVVKNAVVRLHHTTSDETVVRRSKNDDQKVIVDEYSGDFKFENLEPGGYRLEAKADGFNTVLLKDVPWNRKGAAIVMSPTLSASQIRFIMSWEAYPKPGMKDMDVHLLFRSSKTEDCDVNFAWKECAGSNLDRDNINGGQNGAETITIDKPLQTVYTLYLDNYSGDLSSYRGRSSWGVDSPLQADIRDAEWMWPAIPAEEFKGVHKSGWATELSGAIVRVHDRNGEIMSVKVPAHPEDPASDHLHRDGVPPSFDGGYRKETRYVRLLCIDFTGASPKIYKVPQFSSTPPKTMRSCV
jgi:hypothetical protein